MIGISSGQCPGCEECVESGETYDEASFSWCQCGICGSTLGGDRYVWHWINGGDQYGKGGEIVHESDMCVDCLMFEANGDEPEQWSPS